MLKFNVTYQIVTPESAENGEAEETGFIDKDMPLREAIDDLFQTRTSHCDGVMAIEANEYPVSNPSWITVDNGGEYLTGANESRSIHLPDDMTPSSKIRLARLLGCYGV